MQMNVPPISAPGRIADPAVHTDLPQAPPQRPMPAAAEWPAVRPAADAGAAGHEPARTKGERGQQLETELAKANRKLADAGHQLRFEYDRAANELIVRVVDLGTQKVLRQFPSDDALRVARLVQSGKSFFSMRA
jgi:flagellar protein FlaG